MRLLIFILIAAGLLAGAGCSDRTSVQGGSSGNASYGRVKVGVPF